MKTLKKILVGLSPIIVLLATLFLGSASPVVADGFVPRSEYQIRNASLKFGDDRSTIVATFPDDNSSSQKKPGVSVEFVDSDTTDTIFRYLPVTDFCSVGDNGGLWFNKGVSDEIKLDSSFTDTIRAYADLDYQPAELATGNRDCKDGQVSDAGGKPNNKSGSGIILKVDNASVLKYRLKWQDDGSLTPIAPLVTKYARNVLVPDASFESTGLDKVLISNPLGLGCPNVAIVSPDNTSATIYVLATNRVISGESNIKFVDANSLSDLQGVITESKKCWVYAVNHVDHPDSQLLQRLQLAYPIQGNRTIVPSEGVKEPASATGSNEACYNSGWELSWIACPVITAAQTAANAMYGFVEDQLKFTVSQNGDKDSLGDQHENVKKAWNNFRIIVSGLVVILMLVMVISQAIGSGPFDAYTVRKMLPRLVMGVILIQISWPVFSWVVNTVDDLGRGIADLMYAPFGGSEALNLNTIMSGFETEAGAFSWVGIPALLIFGAFAPFIVLGMILTVLAALLFGFLALLFRKIIIILALIFVPVALIAWMMPNDGLRKYWKLWWDNFIKALMMFPLIIAIIAAGRIFAKIGSAQIDFVGFFIVLIGFFGPLFILPKTFKWGGTALQQTASLLSKAQTASLKKPKEALQGFNERYQGKRADMYTPLETGKKGQFWRGLRRVQSGHMVPFSKRSRNLTLQAGTKWAADQNELADAYLKKWVDKAESDEVTPEMVNHYNQMARDMGYTGGDLLDYDKTFKGGGIGAAKWSTLPLMMDATRRGDERIQKAIMRYLPRTKSLLEFANDKFMMPHITSSGASEWLPAYDHPIMIEQAAKNPDTYDAMIAMRSGLLASHNTPHGGANYGDVYKKTVAGAPSYDARYAAAFAGGAGSRPYLAQQMQEIEEDTLAIAAGGGNRAITFHKNIRSWADSPTGRYEDGASSSLPAEKLTEVYVEASRSQAGRQKLQGLLDSPTTQAEVDAALTRSGHTHFRDKLGDMHPLTIHDLLASGERADQQIVSGAATAPAPGARPPLF